jgi:hypothetical protein
MGYIVTGKGSPGWGTSGTPLAGPPTWPATFSSVITTWFSGAAPSYSNGIVSGTSYSPTATTINSGSLQGYYWPPLKQALDDLAAMTGNEYRIKPNGVIDWGVSTSLFRSTPNVCIMPDAGGREGDLTVLNAKRFDVSENIDSYRNASTVVAVSNGVTYVTYQGTGSATWGVDFNDHPLNNPQSYTIYGTNGAVELQTTSYSDAANAAAAIADRYYGPQRDYQIEVDEYCIPRFVTPGDWIYLYHPDADVYDLANQVQFQGQTVTPYKVRCTGYTWPVQAGMGVYVIPDGYTPTPAIVDISDYVEWETGQTTRLDVGDTNMVANLVDSYSRSVID